MLNESRWRGRSWLALGVMVVAAATGCKERGGPPAKQASEPRAVKLVPVTVQAADRYVEVTGTLYGQEEVTISAEVPGRVVSITADLGDRVPAGGELAQIDTTNYELTVREQEAGLATALAKIGLDALPDGEVDLTRLPPVARAEAQAANARSRLDRARKLYERTPPLISEQDYADIQTQVEVAATTADVERLNARSLIADVRVRMSSLGLAQKRLSDTKITAPNAMDLTYRVASRSVSVGEVVAEGQSLFRLVASERVKFRGQAPERFAPQIVVGARAELILDAFPTPFSAVVTRIAPAVDVATRSFEVEIEAPNPEGTLKPGSFARAKIFVGVQADARFVPESAVLRFAGVQRVFSVKDGKVVEHRVQLGRLEGGLREVLDPPAGVDAVIDAPRALAPGAAVTVGP